MVERQPVAQEWRLGAEGSACGKRKERTGALREPEQAARSEPKTVVLRLA
ncbi:MAG: hypothetical protein QOD47_283 [Gemmatimonadaceae bacterium]|jgi:hypothetical protein|nr:hypothetical protein [Gemmatimonadaceae bacterium]